MQEERRENQRQHKIGELTEREANQAAGEVLANNQGELTPLEYGLHALHCVPMGKVGAGRGNKEGLSEYAETVKRNRTQLIEWRKAAAVFESVKNCHNENCQKTDSFNNNNFIDKHAYLSAIHAAPADSWPALCQLSMLKAWINSTTQPGDLVLDPFMGTGATEGDALSPPIRPRLSPSLPSRRDDSGYHKPARRTQGRTQRPAIFESRPRA